MNCTLTVEQQKLLFGKVAIDLKNNAKFDLKIYAKEFHDLVLNKTGDKVLAANYVALLPMNIRAVMGVNKSIFKKLATVAGQISEHEARFEDFTNVENFVNEFSSTHSDLVELEKTLQKESLVVAPEQAEEETTSDIEPLESLSLSDVPFDNDRNNFLKPEMKVYADAKAELLKNVKPDGSSEINGLPVRLTIMSTVDFRVGDLYPDTQRDISAGKESAIKGSKEGVVLAVTRLNGTPIHFNDKLEQAGTGAGEGKIIFYSLRNPVAGGLLNQADKDLVAKIQKEQKISKEEAEAAVIKKLDLIRKVREYVSKDPKNNKVNVDLTGGVVQYAAKPSKTKNTISKLNFTNTQFTPYKGTGTNGLKANVYYFDYSGNLTLSIDSPSIPQELIQKLTQLLAEDVDIRAGKQSFAFSNAEKIRLFKQFVYTEPDVFDLSTDDSGNMIVKKLGVTQSYPNKEAFAQDIQALLTRKVLVKKLSEADARKQANQYGWVTDLRSVHYNQIYKQTLPDGTANFYSVGQVQLKVNDTAFKNNLFNDFILTPREGGFSVDVQSKPYYPFIANNFLISYDVDGAGNLQTAGSVLNFEIQPDSLLKLQQVNNQSVGNNLEKSKKITNLVTETTKHELQNVISGNRQVRSGDNIQAITSYLRAGEGSSAKGGRRQGVSKEGEESRLRAYISKNNFWSKIKLDPLTEIGKGMEQLVYLSEDGKHVYKINNLSAYANWGEYFDNLLLHNYFFPNTAYELIGFTEKNPFPNVNIKSIYVTEKGVPESSISSNKSKIFPIVRQNFIQANEDTNLNDIDKLLGEKGFKKPSPSEENYYNPDLGIELRDLHRKNVLISNKHPFFIDTIFRLMSTFYGEQTISENKLSAKEKLLGLRKDDPDKFNKLTAQKGVDATLEQIDQAEKWYNAHPMSAYFPFETMFDVVNQENSNSIATWTTSGITLFKGADYSDLYHEAWHGFTQGFLNKEEKTKLYNEAKSKSGSFTDYNGNLVDFKKASELQIEEFLAEEFRKYMLSNGKNALGGKTQNSIFRKILNFLKSLFGTGSLIQAVSEVQSNAAITELYQKLRVGDLSSYTFAAENRNFNTLNKALQSIKKDEESLSFENSNLIYNTVDSLFSEGIDVMNQANLEDIEERRELQAKSNLTDAEKEKLKKLNAQITSGYTTLLLSTPKGVRSLYQYAKDRLEDQLSGFIEKNSSSPSTYYQKKINLLSYALRNYGDVDKLYNNSKDAGVIGYHMFKSGLIEDDLFDELNAIKKQEEDDKNLDELTGRESEGKNYFDRGGNETSIFDLAIREIKNIIGSLNKTDIEGRVIENQLGFPELVNYREAFAHIARLIQNSKDLPTMYESLQKEQDVYPPIKQLLHKMGPLAYEGQTDREVDLWSKFFQTFNKYRILLVQTTVNEEEKFKEIKDVHGNIEKVKQKSVYDIRIGNALSDYKRVDQDWRAGFAKAIATEESLIQNDLQGNYLNLNKVFTKYPTMDVVNAEPLQFLNDIGIKMKEIGVIKSEVEKAIKSGNIRLNGIYKNLQKLNELNLPVRGLGTFLQNNPKLGLVGQTGANSNYGKLLIIQSKYSGDYSDFMVKNAAGDPQSEFTQNNTLTQIIKQINSVDSYNELVSNASTAHYNNQKNIPGRPFNPFVNSSIWINSLFNMNADKGMRYVDNELIIENLSGINSSINDEFFQDGVATSQADEAGKLLNDFHIQLMKFTPELTRHAGKKTSLAVSLRNYKTGSKNSKLYIDTENFVANEGEYNQGVGEFYKILVKYIGAELDRVNYAKYLLSPEAGVKEFDFAYLSRGTKFVAFAGVLSEETKNALYKVQGVLADHLSTPEGIALADQMYEEVSKYFNKLVDGVQAKMNQYDFISPSLLEKTKDDAAKIGKVSVPENVLRRGLTSSFVANNWIHHFEEMIMLYGDIALYKDFFKRNAALNSTGDIIRNDTPFIRYANNVLGKPFSKLAGAPQEVLSYNGQYNTAVVSDVLIKSVYLDEYKKTTESHVIEEKYGDKGINEADAQGLISFDTYRIILKGLGKWTTEQEEVFQQLLAGTPASEIDTKQFFPTLKMGYYGPVKNDYLPLTGLHKFALFPLIPGIIPTNLQALHEKMMKEGIDYLTFESGSKVGTISKREGVQPLYSDINKRELSTEPFVKNKIFSDYLKYQVESAPKWKGKMTLPTQLRKLAELGLMENGVPTDYKSGKEAWNKLNETQKKGESKNYRLRQNYIKSLEKLVEAKKSQLLGEIGWKRDKDGNLKGDMSSLLELISNELKRSDVGDHEWAYIQTIKGNDIKNSLDISQSADMIEKVITSLVNKRLINIKVNGEQLVMVSTTGFEDKAFAYSKERNFEKPTEEDLRKYGSNDLPTYHLRNGKIAAAKVKIALQGNFKLLLNLSDVVEKSKQLGVNKLTALNLLLKDDTWLDQDDNRAMISMVGARIPTQGPNSSDFVEVYEFLPEIAGNIIIAPSEVTSKGGSDFDYDKLPLMMPNIWEVNGKIELAKKYNEDQARLVYKELVKANIHKMTFQGLDKHEIRALLRTSDRFEKVDKIVANLLGNDYYEELAKIAQEEMSSFEDFFEGLNGTKPIENELQDSLRKILELESNFAALIRPNETDLIKPFADEIRGDVSKLKEGTRMFEVLHNLNVQQANSVGKDTLGIGAINNAMNAVFESIGLETLPEYEFNDKDFRRATLLFKHNKGEDGGISLSNTADALNENNIADVLSQLINGWVDVEKDDWISYIQGNKEVAPVLLFMVRAGVPIKDIIKFVTQPIIRQYTEEKRLAKNSFSKVLLGADQSRRYKRYAQTQILHRFGIDNPKSKDIYWLSLAFTEGIEDFANLERGLAIGGTKGESTPEAKLETFGDAQSLEDFLKNKKIDLPQFEKSIKDLFIKSASEQEAKFLHRKFTLLTHPDKGGKVEFSQVLNDTYDKYKEGTLGVSGTEIHQPKKAKSFDINLASFLHFIEIENMAAQMDKIQRAFNVDTTPLQSLTEFYGKVKEIEDLKGFVPQKILTQIKDNSPIGPFYIQKFALDLFGRVLPLRNSKVVNEFLNSLDTEDIEGLYKLTDEDEKIRFYQTFKNDLFSYIFQNQLRGFNSGGQNYRNNKVTFPVQSTQDLKFGAFVKDGKLFVDKTQLDKDYENQDYSKAGYGNSLLALVPEKAFVNKDEYYHFVYERETLRANYPFKAVNGSIEFNELVRENERKAELRKEGETNEEFIPRIEKLSYEQLLRDKALYNTFNAWQLFRGPTNVANTYGFILDKYPKLKQYFSVLNNIKKSSKEGLTNLMPSTLKFTKDEIDTFHENLQDLANSNKLLKIEGLNQRDADYISSFFAKLPLYLYMQSGPNTKNAFSFGRIIPQQKIQRILEKPVKDLTEFIDEDYLKEFLPRFITANADKTTRQRFKEFLKPDKEKPTMQTDLFQDEITEQVSVKNQSMSYAMPAKDNITGKDTTTLALAEQGLRTATTRSFPLGKVGDIITFENRPQKYIITGVEQLTEENTIDPNWIKQWSEKEQWTEDYYNSILNKKNTVKVGSFQTSFEKVGTEEKTAEQTTPKQISDEEIQSLMNSCKK